MTATVHPDFVRAPEMLPMPRWDRLRPEQQAGRMCVWCGQPPTVPLGPRLHARTNTRWTPGACQACASREAARVLAIHVTHCQRCVGRDYCLDARALHTLAIASRPRLAARRPSR